MRNLRHLFVLSLSSLAASVAPSASAGETFTTPKTAGGVTTAVSLPCGIEGDPTPVRAGASHKGTQVKTAPRIGAVGDTIKLEGTLSLANGAPVSSQLLRFYIGGKEVGAAKTNGNGVATLPFKVPNELGWVPLEVRYPGNALCSAAKGSAQVSRIRASASLELNPPVEKPRSGGWATVRGALKRSTDNEGIVGRELTVWYGGKQVSKVTSSSYGIFDAGVELPPDAPKNAKVEVRYDGDALYAAASKDVTFEVFPPKKKAVLRYSSVEGKVGETVTLVATLTERTDGYSVLPPPIANRKVRFVIYRDERWPKPQTSAVTLGTGFTAADGRARVPVKLGEKGWLPKAPFGYTLKAYVEEDADLDLEDDSDPQLKITSAPIKVTMQAPPTAMIGQATKIRVHVSRTTDGAPIEGEYVGFGPSGGGATTGTDGDAWISFTPPGGTPTGTLKLSAWVGESKLYGKGETSGSIAITPNTN